MNATAKPARSERVAERVRAELMELLLRGRVHDPDARDLYVTDVVVSADLRHARVYVRCALGDASPERGRRAVKALQRASGFIQRELAPRLELKYQPELRFFWDEGFDRARRVEELLEEIADEAAGGDRE